MNPETQKALKDSIEHWERLSTGNQKLEEEIGTNDCALCRLFYDNCCKGCPVYEETKQRQCRNTPYWIANKAAVTHGINSPAFQAAAAEELAFLKSLTPKEVT